MASNPLEGVIQAMADRRPSSGGQQLALAPGKALTGGGGDPGPLPLHAQSIGEGWEGPWMPAMDPSILRMIIKELMRGGDRINWYAHD